MLDLEEYLELPGKNNFKFDNTIKTLIYFFEYKTVNEKKKKKKFLHTRKKKKKKKKRKKKPLLKKFISKLKR